MSAHAFDPIYGITRDRLPMCHCGAALASMICDYVLPTHPPSVCGAKLCPKCRHDDFGDDLCRGHAIFKGLI